MSLYAISSELELILDAILEGGAVSPEAQQALEAHLAGLDAALDDKADDYAGLIRSLELRSAARKTEAERMRSLAKADEALAERLKDRLKEAMETCGRTKIDTARFRLSVAGNGGKQPLEVTVTAEELGPDYTSTFVEVDNTKIRAALEAGKVVPGCTLLPRGTGLRIK
jgi:hypothetical protein